MEDYLVQELALAAGAEKHLAAGPFYAALFPRAGQFTCWWTGHRWVCGAECIVVLQPGSQALLTAPAQRPFTAAWLRVSPALLRRLSTPEVDFERSFAQAPGACDVVRAAPEAVLLLKHLLDRLIAPGEEAFGQAVFQRGLLEMLLVLLLRACIAEDPYRRAGRRRLPIDDICVFLRVHLAEEVSLERLAGQFYVSPEHLAREFRRRTGETVHGYLTKLRLQHCRRLLDEGFRLANICAQCGFSTPGGLRRAFCREYGLTPQAYRRQNAALQPSVAHSQTQVGGAAAPAGV